MAYYQHHVFFCTNQRPDGKKCCQDFDGQAMRDYTKKRCKALGIHGADQARINSAGCLDRCSEGPVLVVYPEETWYTYVDQADLDEIIESHLQNGKPVTRLMLDQI